jgi:hypothetical protein
MIFLSKTGDIVPFRANPVIDHHGRVRGADSLRGEVDYSLQYVIEFGIGEQLGDFNQQINVSC